MTAATTFEIGTAQNTMATLTSIGAIGCQSKYIDFAETAKLASGRTRGLGTPQAEWYFGYLYKSQYDALRAFCAGAGAAVYIATLTSNMEWIRFTAFMEMPLDWTIRKDNAGDRAIYRDVSIKFTHLVEVVEPS